MAKAKDTTEAQSFDERANKAKLVTERTARKAGDKIKETRFIVNPGQSVRKGGERYTEGEAVDLSEADGERLLHKLVVATPAQSAKQDEAQAAADKAKADAAKAAEKAAEKEAEAKAKTADAAK